MERSGVVAEKRCVCAEKPCGCREAGSNHTYESVMNCPFIENNYIEL